MQEMSSETSDPLAHSELKEVFQATLGKLIESDSILSDLHLQVTLDEVEALLELEHGRAITVYVEKDSGSSWKLVVPRDATLHQLKIALKHHVSLKLSRRGIHKAISWKYVWKTYWLCLEGTKLADDNKKLRDFGITNRTRLTFLKKIKEKSKTLKNRQFNKSVT